MRGECFDRNPALMTWRQQEGMGFAEVSAVKAGLLVS
jgi:hypothetical protein